VGSLRDHCLAIANEDEPSGNLVNLIVQGPVFVLLGMAEVWVLILGEIDLSVGYVAGIGAVITAILAAPPHNFPGGRPLSRACCHGGKVTTKDGSRSLMTKVPMRAPMAARRRGFAALPGELPGSGGTIRITNSVLLDLAKGNLSPLAGWVIGVLSVVAFGAVTILRDRHRRRSGLVAPPVAVTILKVVVVAAATVALILVCNTNRGELVPVKGVPYVVLIIAGFLVAYTFLLGRTGFGRYMYAIGVAPRRRVAQGSVSAGTGCGHSS
jgi:D-xylose transport system permease protein